ncbi:MAG: hypothetical protein HRT44_09975, partial [Bdellovibrionales bacterium]|nr:hypothetical protein [Bdellovibrionales bacterium]NQZ19567.1 hypothetical protein [Bdellovibrionales bacterium]
IGYNFLVQLQAAHRLKESQDINIRVLVAPTLKVDQLKTLAGALAEGVEFVRASPTEMIQGCDLILTASGTATLQVALCEKPMIVMYRMNPMTAVLAKLLVRDVEAFCIVNLISHEKFIPEFFQNEANPEALSQALEKILVDSEYKSSMLNRLKAVKSLLGEVPATKNVVEYLKKKYY